MEYVSVCRRYERAEKDLSSYEADILRHLDAADDVMAEGAAEAVKYLLVDCGGLQQTLVIHANAWATRFTEQLLSVTTKELAALLAAFEANLQALQVCYSVLQPQLPCDDRDLFY